MTPTRNLALRTAALTACLVLSSCSLDPTDRFDDAYCRDALEDPDSRDAFDWLKDNHAGPKRLGALSTDAALAFAHSLEIAGATSVVAARTRPGIGRDPGQTAEGLVVGLPDDLRKRHAVFESYARFVRNEGFEPQGDAGQSLLFLPCRTP